MVVLRLIRNRHASDVYSINPLKTQTISRVWYWYIKQYPTNSSINQQDDPFAAFMATAMRNEAEISSLTEASAHSTSDFNGKISLAIRRDEIKHTRCEKHWLVCCYSIWNYPYCLLRNKCIHRHRRKNRWWLPVPGLLMLSLILAITPMWRHYYNLDRSHEI